MVIVAYRKRFYNAILFISFCSITIYLRLSLNISEIILYNLVIYIYIY